MFNPFIWYKSTPRTTIGVSRDLTFSFKMTAGPYDLRLYSKLVHNATLNLRLGGALALDIGTYLNLTSQLSHEKFAWLQQQGCLALPRSWPQWFGFYFPQFKENNFHAAVLLAAHNDLDITFNYFPWAELPNPYPSPLYLTNELPQWLRMYSDHTSVLARFLSGWVKGGVLNTRWYMEHQKDLISDISQPRSLYKIALNKSTYPTDESITQIEVTVQNVLYGGEVRTISQASSLRECIHSKTDWGIWYYNASEGALYLNNVTLMRGVVSSGYGWVDLSPWFSSHPPDPETPLYIEGADQGWEAPCDSEFYQYPYVNFPYNGNFTIYYSDSTLSANISGLTIYLDGIAYPLEKKALINSFDKWAYLYDLERFSEELNSLLKRRTGLSSILSSSNRPFISLGAQFSQVVLTSWYSSGPLILDNPASQLIVLDLPAQELIVERLTPASGIVQFSFVPLSGMPFSITQVGTPLKERKDYWVDTITQDGAPVGYQATLSQRRPSYDVTASYWIERYTLNTSGSTITGITPTNQCPEAWYVVLSLEDITWQTVPKHKLQSIYWDRPLTPNRGLGTFD